MSLLTQPYLQLFDTNAQGRLIFSANAEAYFYQTGTTTPATVYEDADLQIEHATPVEADQYGIFPAIFFSSNDELRMKVVHADGDPDTPVIDIDPVSQLISIGAANIEDGAIEEKLGYTPANSGGQVFTGPVRLNYTPLSLSADAAGFLGRPVSIHNENYTFVLSDAGKSMIKDDTGTYDWTIPPNVDVAFPVGTIIYILNRNATNLDLVRGSGVELTESADATFTDEDKVIAPGTITAIYQTVTDEWVLVL